MQNNNDQQIQYFVDCVRQAVQNAGEYNHVNIGFDHRFNTLYASVRNAYNQQMDITLINKGRSWKLLNPHCYYCKSFNCFQDALRCFEEKLNSYEWRHYDQYANANVNNNNANHQGNQHQNNGVHPN
jgi:Pyruvate/2-oxoacid:ferredoxin oxidoreductase delta subunit